MSKGKHRGCIHGVKFCRHTTVTEPARKVAEFLNNLSEVTKIANGTISGKGPSQFSIKFLEIYGGWTLNIYGNHVVQKLHVYTADPAHTREKLELKFSNNIR